jgi:type I restriction enzyme S subunit
VLLRPQLFTRYELPITCASFSRFIRFRTDLCDPEFIFWYLQYLYEAGFMHAYHTQHTGVARFQWTTFSEREPLHLPPLSVQRRIAGILSAYDDLIENNQRRIKILEEMARSLYREWFVNFRFPGHEKVPLVDSTLGPIPKGWEVSEFRDLFNIKYGKTLPMSEVKAEGLYPVYGAGDVIGYYDTLLCAEKCALVTSRGNGSGTVWRTREAAFVTNNSLIILPQERLAYWSYPFVELLLKHANIMEAKTGSAQPQVTIENLNYVKGIAPSRRVVERFCEVVMPLYEQVDLLIKKNANLRRTRDLLLPRLLSGQITIPKVEANFDRPAYA